LCAKGSAVHLGGSNAGGGADIPGTLAPGLSVSGPHVAGPVAGS
jgi:hypothetical protein